MIRRLIILLLIVRCGTEPEDCAGVAGGTAVEDDCGVCDGIDGYVAGSCYDCADTPNGDKLLDNCGTCDNDVTNDCEKDCADEWGGDAVLSGCDNLCNSTATEDNCSVCDGNNSPDTGTCDCEGTPNGTAWVSDCGCVSIVNDGNDCDDCSNVPNGTAVVDNCGVCEGDGSTCEGLWNVYYDVDVPIAGFQFQVNGGTLVSASGGAASDAGLLVSTSSSIVLAFSLSSSTIPSGTGTLISLELVGDSNSFCISNLVLSNISGDSIPAIIENCNTIKYSDN